LNVEDIYELSPLQRALLTRLLSGQGPTGHVRQAIYRLGPMNESFFWKAWAKVSERHPVLRTSFHWEGLKAPVQVVHRKAEPVPRVEDWTSLSADSQAARLVSYLKEDRERPFSLTLAPLIRWGLFRLGTGAFSFVWSYHPIILDGESAQLVFEEVLALSCEPRQEGFSLPVPGRFRDCVVRVRECGVDAAEDFWRRALRGFTVPTPLPRQVAGSQLKEEFQDQRLWLPPPGSAAIARAAERHGVTVETLLVASWALLLGGSRSNEDVVFGLSVSSRPATLPRGTALAGPLRNTVPVRVSLPAREPIGAWLGRLRQQLEAMGDYAFLSPDLVRGCAEVPPACPLYQTALAFEMRLPGQPGGADAQAVQAQPLPSSAARPNHPLVLSGRLQKNEFLLRLTHATDLLGPEAAERLIKRFRGLLMRLTRAPSDKPLGQVVPLRRQRHAALVCLRAQGERPTFFCVHGAGGSILPYGALAHHVGAGQPFYAFEPRGLEDRQRPQDRIEDMAASYLAILREVQPHGPYFLGGWSAGGLVAYEMARRLVGLGEEVALLALFDAAVPDPQREPARPRAILGQLARRYGVDLSGRKDLKTTTEALAVILREARAASTVSVEVSEADLRRQARLYRSHAMAVQAYSPPAYPGRLTLFRAAEQSDAQHSDQLGWDRFAAAVDVCVVPGNHETLFREPHVRALGEQLAQRLATAGRREGADTK
jgi:thioesterase domain-containing protein